MMTSVTTDWILVALAIAAYFQFWRLNSNASASHSKSSAVISKPPTERPPANWSGRQPPPPSSGAIGDSPDSLFTWIQISDIHISRYLPKGGFPHFQSFLENELPLVGPDLVILTGDLVDSKSQSTLTSEQYLDEWLAYQAMLNRSGVLERQAFYFDQRGNHDCFNLGDGFNGSEFAKMSAVRRPGYVYHHRKTFGTYNFVALDACPNVGTSRPFNFFGVLDNADMNILASVVDKAGAEGHNHTFVATHYPTSTLITGFANDGRGMKDLAPRVSMWVCGHLHRLVLDIGKKMYAFHASWNLLELELSDMKDNAVFRIVAVDHDMISFTDEYLSLETIPSPRLHNIIDSPTEANPTPPPRKPFKPIILVTNPRDARFASPGNEPVTRIRSSKFIRFLLWSETPVAPEDIRLSFDGQVATSSSGEPLQPMPRFKGDQWRRGVPVNETGENFLPLWILQWNPSVFDDGWDHELVVDVIGRDGNSVLASKRIVFRVDGARAKNEDMGSGLGGKVILARFSPFLKSCFVLAHVFLTAAFLLARLFGDKFNQKVTSHPVGLRERILADRSRAGSSAPSESGGGGQQVLATPQPIGSRPYRRLRTRTGSTRDGMEGIQLCILWCYSSFLDLVGTPSYFYPLFSYLLYVVSFPWFLGSLVPSATDDSNRIGAFYTVGIWFWNDEGWIPMLDTWFYSLWSLISLFTPLMLYLAARGRALHEIAGIRANGASIERSASAGTVLRIAVFAAEKVLVILWLFVSVRFINMVPSYGAITIFTSPPLWWFWLWAVAQVGMIWWNEVVFKFFRRGSQYSIVVDDAEEGEEDGLNLTFGEAIDSASVTARRRNRSRDTGLI
ncbi:Metallo-dependent phosphatase-like protein [Zopfochytrium polystomum]|nr:Metallo-dependent phosphatase-like protein [Zopfochytrium polystomum]